MASTAVMRSRAQASSMLWPGTAGCDRAKKPREETGSFSCWWQGQTLTVRIDHCGALERELAACPCSHEQTEPNCSQSLQQTPCQFDRHSSDPCQTRVPWLLPLGNAGEAKAGGSHGPSALSTAKQHSPSLLPRAGSRDPAHPETQIHCRMLSGKQEKGGARTQVDSAQLRALCPLAQQGGIGSRSGQIHPGN